MAAKPPAVGKNPPVSPSMPELKSPPSIAQLKSMMQVVGSKRRKRSRNGTGSVEEVQEGAKQTKVIYLTNQGSILPTCLQAAFTSADPKSAKRTVKPTLFFFALLRSAHKTLVK